MPQETWRQGRPQRCLSKSYTSRPDRTVQVGRDPVQERASERNRSVQICRSRGPGNVKSWVRISRGVQQHARPFTPKVSEHQSSGAVLSPQSSSCGRPRAQTQGAQSQEGYKAAPQRKLLSIGFSQRNWKIIPAKAKYCRHCEFKNFSKHLQIFYDTESVMLQEHYDGQMF